MGMKTMGDWDQIIRTLLAIIMIMGFTLTSTLGGIICHCFKRITLTTLEEKHILEARLEHCYHLGSFRSNPGVLSIFLCK